MIRMRKVDVLVVGAGVMGAATAWRLAQRGLRPVVLEQFDVGHAHGSSHGTVRVFRFSYGDPAYVRMAMEALTLWREIERASGRDLLTSLGQLDWGEPYVEANLAAMQACGAEARFLDGSEASDRYPVSLPPGERVLFHPAGGIVRAEASVRAFLESAAALGAELHQGTRAVALRASGSHTEVLTEDDVYRAEAVILTAGAWVKPLAATAGIELPVVPSLETVAFFDHPDEMSLPVLVEWGEPTLYGLPDPSRGIKVGAHHTGPDTEPGLEGRPDPAIADRLAAWAGAHYPKADLASRRAETCLYTNTADERFILERHGPIVVGSPCSGHGFKFAPLIGERLAGLAQG
jgi:sarcosine oxidase